MKAIVTEKPSVAREFADILNANNAQDGYIEGNGWIITWCVGHLITLSMPEKYDEGLKKWSMDTLPFLPERYKYEVIPQSRDQYKVVKEVLNRPDVTTVYNAGDSGREGEYIQRLVYQASGINGKKEILRVWIDSQTEAEIKRGIREAKPSSEYDRLADAAYMRAIMDYATGINFSRLLTLKYGKKLNANVHPGEKKKKLSIGRVMTCVLGMVVKREREIKNFKETVYYKVEASCGTFMASWKIDKDSAYFDLPSIYNNSGFLKKEDAVKFLMELSLDDVLTVEEIERKKEKKSAPLLYNLAELQAECSRRFKISPDKTLEIAQTLYEAKLTTYPRTDARVLSTAVAAEIGENLKGLKNIGYHSEFAEKILSSGSYRNIGKSTRYTDDNKITDHYAIIPTGQGNVKNLDDLETGVFHLIIDRFLAIFLPAAEYGKTSITLRHSNNEKFTATSKKLLFPGYLELYGTDGEEKKDDDEDSAGNVIPPELQKGIKVRAEYGLKESRTQPPKRYTSGSMILAMENAGNLIEEEELRAQIKGSGIGTSATRAEIIKKLDTINHISINKKTQVITPTDDGEQVYDIVKEIMPDLLSPKMTASWEKGLSQIEEGTLTRAKYTEVLNNYIKKKTGEVKEMNGGKDFGSELYEDKDMDEPCPHCGGRLTYNAYGVKCQEKCGMSFSYFGNALPEKAVRRLISGGSIVVTGKSKKGNPYNARITPKGITEYTYTNKKTGEEKTGFQWEFDSELVDDKGKEYGSETMGKCPNCGKPVVNGMYGPECSGKCGMSFRYFGKAFSEEQVKALLKNKPIVMSQKSKKTKKFYKVKLTPIGTEEFSYENKDGKEVKGTQFTFKSEFVNKKK